MILNISDAAICKKISTPQPRPISSDLKKMECTIEGMAKVNVIKPIAIAYFV